MQSSCHPAALPVEQLLSQCEVTRTRRSGPGGQHRNKVETAIVLQHRPTGTKAEASERRSQADNLRVAAFRLRLNLALAVRGTLPADYRPGALWQSRCRDGRIVVSADHDDFPAILAEALDVIASHGMDLKPAATILGCTPSQLTKLLQQESRALTQINQSRERLGFHKLK